MVNYIGIGVYTLQEAALYGSVSPNKLFRWIFGTRIHPPVIKSQLFDEGLVSFYDLVQAKAINVVRNEGISLQKIRDAIKTAQDCYRVEFPLAREHKLLWFEGNLHIELPSGIYQVSGRPKHQMGIKPIVEPYAKDLHFDGEGLVSMWVPFKRFGRQIILNPKRQFGQPLVGETGYRADMLAEVYAAEKSEDAVATAYNIDIKDVKVAVAYMKHIKKAAA